MGQHIAVTLDAIIAQMGGPLVIACVITGLLLGLLVWRTVEHGAKNPVPCKE